jgi:hypothetical protein
MDAKDATKALTIYQADRLLWQRIRQTIGQRGEPALERIIDSI